jgi:hypothetical protein
MHVALLFGSNTYEVLKRKSFALFNQRPPVIVPRPARWLALHCTSYHHVPIQPLLMSSGAGASLLQMPIRVFNHSGQAWFIAAAK